MLEECQILLSLQEMDLEVCEAKLAEEQARDLYPFDEQDLLTELELLHALVAGTMDERAAEVGKLSTLVVQISIALVDLGCCPSKTFPSSQRRLWKSWRWLVSSGSAYERSTLPVLVHGTELSPTTITLVCPLSYLSFFCFSLLG
jgi:hypothetical protein